MNEIVTPVHSEFIRVICWPKYPFPVPQGILYKQFHPVVLESSIEQSKLNYWKKLNLLPPNVLILGVDSMSRANFRRSMPETKKFLEEIGAVELFGHTKGH